MTARIRKGRLVHVVLPGESDEPGDIELDGKVLEARTYYLVESEGGFTGWYRSPYVRALPKKGKKR